MKKVLATILAFLYLATSTGATVHLHYCMGKLVSWSLVNKSSSRCSFCGMLNKPVSQHCMLQQKGCCKDEQQQIKTAKDHSPAATELELSKPAFHSPAIHEVLRISYDVPSFVIDQPKAHAPPITDKVPVFLFHCHFCI